VGTQTATIGAQFGMPQEGKKRIFLKNGLTIHIAGILALSEREEQTQGLTFQSTPELKLAIVS
jgi:hypothetical protein